MIAESLPYWPIDPSLSPSPWYHLPARPGALPLGRPAGGLPVGSELSAGAGGRRRSTGRTGRLVGGVYAANTVGAIVGALAVQPVADSGARHAARAAGADRSGRSRRRSWRLFPSLVAGKTRRAVAGAMSGGRCSRERLALAGVALAWRRVPTVPGELIAYGRRLPTYGPDEPKHALRRRGDELVGRRVGGDDGVRNFHVSGKVEASSEPQDMRLQRMLGHISGAAASTTQVGAGRRLRRGRHRRLLRVHPGVERIVICEIEPLIPASRRRRISRNENYDVVQRSAGRGRLRRRPALHPHDAGEVRHHHLRPDPPVGQGRGDALHARNTSSSCKQHLNPGGVVTQWVPLYESNADAVKSEIATFFEVFPDGTVWSNDVNGKGYDVVLLGQVGPLSIDVDRLQERLGRPDHFPVDESLNQVGFSSGLDLLATYAGTAADLAPWLQGAEINRDRNLRLQYLAGFAAHDYREAAIYNEMLQYRRYPEKLFIASTASSLELKRRLGFAGSGP